MAWVCSATVLEVNVLGNREKELNERAGFSGHLHIIARAIAALEVDESDVQESLSSNDDWQAFVTNDVTAYTHQTQWQETYV